MFPVPADARKAENGPNGDGRFEVEAGGRRRKRKPCESRVFDDGKVFKPIVSSVSYNSARPTGISGFAP